MQSETKLIQLSNIADIFSGHTFKGSAEASEPLSDYNLRVIQIQDIQDKALQSVSTLKIANIRKDHLKSNLQLRKSDIVMPLKGSRTSAMLIDIKDETYLTATNLVAIIRLNNKIDIRPDYLFWYLNINKIKARISNFKMGSTVPSLSIRQLKSIEIEVPDKKTQNDILYIYYNWLEQKSTLEELIANGEKITNKICMKKINEIGLYE